MKEESIFSNLFIALYSCSLTISNIKLNQVLYTWPFLDFLNNLVLDLFLRGTLSSGTSGI